MQGPVGTALLGHGIRSARPAIPARHPVAKIPKKPPRERRQTILGRDRPKINSLSSRPTFLRFRRRDGGLGWRAGMAQWRAGRPLTCNGRTCRHPQTVRTVAHLRVVRTVAHQRVDMTVALAGAYYWRGREGQATPGQARPGARAHNRHEHLGTLGLYQARAYAPRAQTQARIATARARQATHMPAYAFARNIRAIAPGKAGVVRNRL